MARLPGLYRLALRSLPRDFRERHAHELGLALEDALRDRPRLSRVAAIGVASLDVLLQAVRLRWQQRRVGATEELRLDLMFAARSLARRPAFTGVAVAVLAVGIGASTTIFALAHGVVLRPLPYANAERVGILWHDLGGGAQSLPAVNPADVYDYRAWSESFEAFTFGVGEDRPVRLRGRDRVVQTALVEWSFLDFFGVRPARGRPFSPEDGVPGTQAAALLSDRLWRDHLGGDPSVVGTTLEVDGEPTLIVGVLPADFRLLLPQEAIFLRDSDVWLALRADAETNFGGRTLTVFTAFARLRSAVTFAEAQRELDEMTARLRNEHQLHAEANTRARVVPLQHDVVKQARSGLAFLFVAVSLLLIVASANVANLALTRLNAREEELAVRAALGAGRGRVVRLVVLESLLLVVVGGVLALALASGGIEASSWLGREGLPRADTLRLDGAALGFAVVASLLAGLTVSVIPALRAAPRGPAGPLPGLRRMSADRAGARARDGLIVVEVALSVALLVGTGLMLRSFLALQRVDPGFSSEGVLTVRVALPVDAYPDPTSRWDFLKEAQARLTSHPEVLAFAAVTQLPLTGPGYLQPYAYNEETARNWEAVTSDRRFVTPGYFEAMGSPVLAGRDFTWGDVESGEPVILVDEVLAGIAFPDGQAVGRTLQVTRGGAMATVIGVVPHSRFHHLAYTGFGQMYTRLSAAGWLSGGGSFTLVARTERGATFGADDLLRELEALVPGIALGEVRPMSELVVRALMPARSLLVLMVVFGGVALALSAVGLYGVLSHAVERRTREIGIRIALGQSHGRVQRSILVEGARLVLVATLVGLALSAMGGQVAATLFYGVNPVDPVTYLAVTVVLLASALLACWLPARRATRIDPVRAIAAE